MNPDIAKRILFTLDSYFNITLKNPKKYKGFFTVTYLYPFSCKLRSSKKSTLISNIVPKDKREIFVKKLSSVLDAYPFISNIKVNYINNKEIDIIFSVDYFPLDKLPDVGIYSNILSNLDMKDISFICLVSKKFATVYDDTTLWSNLLLIKFPNYKYTNIKRPDRLYTFLLFHGKEVTKNKRDKWMTLKLRYSSQELIFFLIENDLIQVTCFIKVAETLADPIPIIKYLIDNNKVSKNKLKSFMKFILNNGMVKEAEILAFRYPKKFTTQYFQFFNIKKMPNINSIIWIRSVLGLPTDINYLLSTLYNEEKASPVLYDDGKVSNIVRHQVIHLIPINTDVNYQLIIDQHLSTDKNLIRKVLLKFKEVIPKDILFGITMKLLYKKFKL